MMSKSDQDDDAAWDAIAAFCLQVVFSLAIGVLVFVDLIIMDVRWLSAALATALIMVCVAAKVGVWTIRKFALALTLYAAGYLIGALPNIAAVGAYFMRLLS